MSSYIGPEEDVHLTLKVHSLSNSQHFACPNCTYHFTLDLRDKTGAEEEDPEEMLIWSRVSKERSDCRHVNHAVVMRGFCFTLSTTRRVHRTNMVYRHIFRTEQARQGLALPTRNPRFAYQQ